MHQRLLEVLNPYYRVRNLAAYNYAGFACIAIAVFLLASQPFYLSQVIKLKSSILGSTIGTLGVIDELTAIFVAPFCGTLIDYINKLAWRSPRIPSGTKIVSFFSFIFLFIALSGYGTLTKNVFPDLWLARSLFAVGVTGVMSTVVVMLHESSSSDFQWKQLLIWKKTIGNEYSQTSSAFQATTEELSPLMDEVRCKRSNNGKLSALLGICTGLGAIFSVSTFLTLPNRLEKYRKSPTPESGIKLAYVLIGFFALLSSLVVLLFGYDCVRQRRARGLASAPDALNRVPFFLMMKQGFQASLKNQKIQIAYCGALVSRASSVAISVFIPLLVFKFYSATGKCGSSAGESTNESCREGFVFLAILTGVAQTAALLLTPLWGVLVDSKRFGNVFTLMIASITGLVGSMGLCLLGYNGSIYDPRNVSCFLVTSCIACSQIGVIISSMSLLSTFGIEDSKEDHSLIGSVTGLYHLCGGVGILLLSKTGGSWSDQWTLGPFFILGLLNVVLTLLCFIAWRRDPIQILVP